MLKNDFVQFKKVQSMKNNKYCKKILITVRCTLYIVHFTK
jgi:hypothetical protein